MSRDPTQGGPARRAALCLALAVGVVGIAVLAARWWSARFRAYVVAGESMLPALAPGDYALIDLGGYRSRDPRPDEIVLARDPRDPARTILKRIGWIDPAGSLWLIGDNPARSTDSRTFGAIPRDLLLGRMRLRYWRSGVPPDSEPGTAPLTERERPG